MGRIVYVNGEYLPKQDAKISIFDRGFLFTDGVYEVAAILQGHRTALFRRRGMSGTGGLHHRGGNFCTTSYLVLSDTKFTGGNVVGGIA